MSHTIKNVSTAPIRLINLELDASSSVTTKFSIEPNEVINLTNLRNTSGTIFSNQQLRDAVYKGDIVFVVGGVDLTQVESEQYFTDYSFAGGGGGGVDPKEVKNINADYTATEADQFIICDCSANSIVLTLPSTPTKGFLWYVKREDKNSNFTLKVSTGTTLIDGLGNQVQIDTTFTSSFNNAAGFLYDGNKYQFLDLEIEGVGFQLSGARRGNGSTDRDLESNRVLTNLTPIVIEQNCKLVGISASTENVETWEAHIYKNGVSVAFLPVTAAAKATLSNLDVNFVQGDELRFRQQNSVGAVRNPRIIAYFK
jgi:hypothetical protein